MLAAFSECSVAAAFLTWTIRHMNYGQEETKGVLDSAR